MTKTSFNNREIVAIEDFIEASREYINRYYFRFNNISNKKTPSMWIENYNNEHDYVIIHFWDAKIILELSTKGDEKHKLESVDLDESDNDDQKYYLIHFSYSKKPKPKNLRTYDSIESALEGVFEVLEIYANQPGISFEDNLFIEKFKSVELNEIEIFKNRIENIIRDREIEDKLHCEFKIRNDNYLYISFVNGYIEMSFDRAKTTDTRLFVIEDFIDDGLFDLSYFEGEEILSELYIYTSISEAIEKILFLLDGHIKYYLYKYS